MYITLFYQGHIKKTIKRAVQIQKFIKLHGVSKPSLSFVHFKNPWNPNSPGSATETINLWEVFTDGNEIKSYWNCIIFM